MNSFEAVVYLAGGLALFVFGLKLFSDSCRRRCGKHIVGWLYLYTDGRLRAACVGIPAALSLPYPGSSAALVANMGEAGLFSVRQAIAVLLGTSIGGALLVEVFAFDLGVPALALVVIGALAHFMARGTRLSG
jgi:phosphate:Na+ symporter